MRENADSAALSLRVFSVLIVSFVNGGSQSPSVLSATPIYVLRRVPVSPATDGAADPVAVSAVQVGGALERVEVTEVRDRPVRLHRRRLQLRVEQVQERDVRRTGGGVIGLHRN